jgi:hypothetical protein
MAPLAENNVKSPINKNKLLPLKKKQNELSQTGKTDFEISEISILHLASRRGKWVLLFQ